jgi:hypothetical protein
MTKPSRGFREQLLDVEPFTPALQERYHKELKAMFEQKLTGWRRWVWLFPAIGGAALALTFAAMAALMPAGFPLPGRLGFAGAALFCVGWCLLGIKVFRRRSLDLKFDAGAANSMSWGMPLLLVTVFMVSAPDSIVGLRMILSGLVFLLIGAVFMIGQIVQRTSLTTREKLLEIECRLAELTERLSAERPPSA